MNKRIGYPIIFFVIYIIINVAPRTVGYAFDMEGNNNYFMYFMVYFDLFVGLIVPAIIYFEAVDNKPTKLVAIMFAVFSLLVFLENIVLVYELEFIPTAFFLVLELGVLGFIGYLGFLSAKTLKDTNRIGRAIMASVIVIALYMLAIPNSLQRLVYTYQTFSLNTFVLIIFIMQLFILDDILVEREVLIRERRKVIKIEEEL